MQLLLGYLVVLRVPIWRFLNRRPPYSEFEGTKSLKGMCINRNTSFEPLAYKLDQNATCELAEDTEKSGWRKSQNRYISPPRGYAISKWISSKCGEFVDLTEVVTPDKFGSKILIGFSTPRGGKKHFPFRKPTAYITVPHATALACDKCRSSHLHYMKDFTSVISRIIMIIILILPVVCTTQVQ